MSRRDRGGWGPLGRLAHGDVGSAAELHRAAFRASPFPSWGDGSSRTFCRGSGDVPNAVTVTARAPASGGLPAVAVGAPHPEGCYGRLVMDQVPRCAAAASSAVVRRPWIVPRLVRTLPCRGDVPLPVSGELRRSICVSPAAQGAWVRLRGTGRVAAASRWHWNGCGVPDDGRAEQRLRQPVLLEAWVAPHRRLHDGRGMNFYLVDGSPV